MTDVSTSGVGVLHVGLLPACWLSLSTVLVGVLEPLLELDLTTPDILLFSFVSKPELFCLPPLRLRDLLLELLLKSPKSLNTSPLLLLFLTEEERGLPHRGPGDTWMLFARAKQDYFSAARIPVVTVTHSDFSHTRKIPTHHTLISPIDCLVCK